MGTLIQLQRRGLGRYLLLLLVRVGLVNNGPIGPILVPVRGSYLGVSENWGTLFWGPYKKDPTI